MNTKSLAANIAKLAKGFVATISTETVDRDGEVLVPSGMILPVIKSDGKGGNVHASTIPLQVMHPQDPRSPVSGRLALPIGTVKNFRRNERSISAEGEFAPRPDGYVGEWEPDYIAGLVAAGALNTVSVGFRTVDGFTRQATKGDVAKYGPDVTRVFSRWELYELSLVSIPANPEAIVTAVTKGYVTESQVKRFSGVTVSANRPQVHRITVSVPSVGMNDITKAVSKEVAKLSGQIWVRR